MLKKMKNNKKGFTLVELIVVLVILAILAALLIPALTGYIDRARDKQIISETRQAVMAAQTLVDEKYAALETAGTITIGATDSTTCVATSAIQDLAEVKGTIETGDGKTAVDNKGHVSKLVYTKGGKTCTYDASKAGGNDAYSVN